MGNSLGSPSREGAIDDDPGGNTTIPILQFWKNEKSRHLPCNIEPHLHFRGPVVNSSNVNSDKITSGSGGCIHERDDLDLMEKGQSMEVEDHDDILVALATRYIYPGSQAPRNICQCTGQSEFITDHNCGPTTGHPRKMKMMVRDGGDITRVSMNDQRISSSEKEDYPRLELMSQRYAERIYGPNRARSALASKKEPDVPSNGTLYAPNHWTVSLLLEKAILRWHSAPRYVGLYPHSADPPLQYTKNLVPEPNPQNDHTNIALYHRPRRSQITTTNKQSHQHERLLRAHRLSKLAESLLSSLLQVFHAVVPIVLQYLPIPRISYLGRIYKKAALSRLYRSQLHKHFKTTTARTTNKMELITDIEVLCQQWLNQDMIEFESVTQPDDSSPPSEELQISQPEYNTEHQQHLSFDSDYTLYPPPAFNIFDGSMSYYSYNNGLVHLHQLSSPVPTSAPPPLDWKNFVNFSGASTPASSAYAEFEMEIPLMGTNPGLSLPTSQNVTPLTEGLETPNFTPSYSPVAVASPPQQLSPPRRYVCEYESCGHKQFDRPCDLHKHLKTHIKHLECDYAAEGCLMRFSTEKDKNRHHATVHEKRRDYVCHACVKQGAKGRFSRKDNLRHHIRTVHKDELDCQQ